MFEAANCSAVPAQVPSDAGIAGAGVLLSSTITATLALLISASLIVQDVVPVFSSSRSGAGSGSSNPNPSVIRRKLLNGYSDQQIMVGIGIQSVGLVKATSIVSYHFFLIWLLSLLSTATHNAALLALVRDFRRDRVLRAMRQALMLLNLVLSSVYGIFVLRAKTTRLPPTMPIACAWAGTSTVDAAQLAPYPAGVDYVGTVATLAGNCVVFALSTWYLQSRRQRFYKVVQWVGLILMAAVAIGATARAYLLSQAFGTPDVPLADEGEKTWSFGQLLSMLMLILPVISVIEIMRGEVAVAPPVDDTDDEIRALVGQSVGSTKGATKY